MAASHRDAIFSTLQFLEGNNLLDSARTLERESGLYFNMNFFKDCFIYGAFEEAEEYISGFTTVHDNSYSTHIFHEIRWHKFLKAMDNNRLEEAKYMLYEFKDFERYNANIITQMVGLLDLENFRAFKGHPVDLELERRAAWEHVKSYLEANPRLSGKLQYQINPNIGGFPSSVPPGQAAQPAGLGLLGNGNSRTFSSSCFPRSRRI